MSYSNISKKCFERPNGAINEACFGSYFLCIMPMVANAEIVGPNAATPMRAKGGVVLELCKLPT